MKASQQHIRTDLKSLLEAAADLATRLGGTSDEAAQRASGRLSASVIRPLRQAAGARPGDGEPASRCGADGTARAAPSGEGLSVSPPYAVWQLARAVTELRSQSPEVAELAEAAAALQDLAIGLADEASAAGRLAELAVLQGGLGPGIQAMTDGPYLVTGARSVLDWLGAAGAAATGAVPLRRLEDEAAVRRHPRHGRLHRAAKTRAGSPTAATPTPVSR